MVQGKFKNRVGPQGFVTEDIGVNGNTSFFIENHAGHTSSNVLYVSPQGEVNVLDNNNPDTILTYLTSSYANLVKSTSGSLATAVKYAFFDHNATQTITDNNGYVALKCNGQLDHVDGGISVWNTSSNVFEFNQLGAVYTIRLSGKSEALGGGGNGVIHVDFALSGALPPNYVQGYNRQKQGVEITTRANATHIDILAIYTVFVDSALLASGGQIYATSTVAGGVQLNSCSIFIKEGLKICPNNSTD